MCKHEWKEVYVGNGLSQDECRKCGCIGLMDFNTGKIKAKPMAKILNFRDIKYKKSRGVK